jgi:hypothetical protein
MLEAYKNDGDNVRKDRDDWKKKATEEKHLKWTAESERDKAKAKADFIEERQKRM